MTPVRVEGSPGAPYMQVAILDSSGTFCASWAMVEVTDSECGVTRPTDSAFTTSSQLQWATDPLLVGKIWPEESLDHRVVPPLQLDGSLRWSGGYL
jgi:hypothetical protein